MSVCDVVLCSFIWYLCCMVCTSLISHDPQEQSLLMLLFVLLYPYIGMTYDDLWNAAQLQMVQEGKMHVSTCNCIF